MQAQNEAILTPHDKLMIFLTLLIIIVTPFAADSYTPSLPAITNAFAITGNTAQLTMSTYLVGAAFSQLIYGPLAERHGRRPIILIGLIITVIGCLVCACSPTILVLFFGRAIEGIGAGVCNSLSRAVMRDSFTGPKMAQAGSYAGMFYTFAYAAAPILGGYVQHYFGWQANFIFSGVVIFAIFAILWQLLPETHLKLDQSATQLTKILTNYFRLLTNTTFIGYSVISSLAFSGLIAYYTSAPFILQNILGLSAVQFGWMSLGLAAGAFFGLFLNARLVVRFGINKMLFLGVMIMFLSGSLMLTIGLFGIINVPVILIPVFCFCTAAGLVFANAMTKAIHDFAAIAGIAGGLYGFLQIFGSSLTSLLVAYVHESNQVPLATIYTGLGITALILFALLMYKEERQIH